MGEISLDFWIYLEVSTDLVIAWQPMCGGLFRSICLWHQIGRCSPWSWAAGGDPPPRLSCNT